MSDDSLSKALELLAQQEEQFAQSSGAGLSDPDDGTYSVILRKFNVGLGTYGRYRTGKDGVDDPTPCVQVIPIVEIFDDPTASGLRFNLASFGFFSNREGSPTRKHQDLDQLKTVICALLGIRITEWTTTNDMIQRCKALENIGQYKVRVKRSPSRDGKTVFTNKDIQSRLADASA